MAAVNYLWNPINDNIVREFDDAGNTLAEYTTEPGYHGAVISEHRDGQTYYHHHDGQGNLRALTNDQGEVTDTFAYTSNGELTERTGNTPTPFEFGGQHGYYTDQTTGEIMARRRDFDPPTGRWLSKDLLPFLDGANVYVYVLNNPVNLIDPSGLAAQAPKTVVTSCPVTSGTCNIGKLDGSRLFLLLNDRTIIEQGAPVPAGKWKNGMGFAVGFALAEPFTPKGCEPLCCRGYGIIQVYCTDSLTVAPGAKPKPAGKPNCRVDNYNPDLGQKPLPEPYYGGVYFEWGDFLPMLRPPGYPVPINDPKRYPPDIYDHFSSDKYAIAIFDRPNATVGATGTWKRDEFEACLVCDTGLSLKILQCITNSMDAQTNDFTVGKQKFQDVNVVQNLTSNCTNGSLVKLGMKNDYPNMKIE